MADEGQRITTLGKIISILLILGLVALGAYLIWAIRLRNRLRPGPTTATDDTASGKAGRGSCACRAPDTNGITTVRNTSMSLPSV